MLSVNSYVHCAFVEIFSDAIVIVGGGDEGGGGGVVIFVGAHWAAFAIAVAAVAALLDYVYNSTYIPETIQRIRNMHFYVGQHFPLNYC